MRADVGFDQSQAEHGGRLIAGPHHRGEGSQQGTGRLALARSNASAVIHPVGALLAKLPNWVAVVIGLQANLCTRSRLRFSITSRLSRAAATLKSSPKYESLHSCQMFVSRPLVVTTKKPLPCCCRQSRKPHGTIVPSVYEPITSASLGRGWAITQVGRECLPALDQHDLALMAEKNHAAELSSRARACLAGSRDVPVRGDDDYREGGAEVEQPSLQFESGHPGHPDVATTQPRQSGFSAAMRSSALAKVAVT